jgi:hypothetical protein
MAWPCLKLQYLILYDPWSWNSIVKYLRINHQYQKICLPDSRCVWRSAVCTVTSDTITATYLKCTHMGLPLPLPLHFSSVRNKQKSYLCSHHKESKEMIRALYTLTNWLKLELNVLTKLSKEKHDFAVSLPFSCEMTTFCTCICFPTSAEN